MFNNTSRIKEEEKIFLNNRAIVYLVAPRAKDKKSRHFFEKFITSNNKAIYIRSRFLGNPANAEDGEMVSAAQ